MNIRLTAVAALTAALIATPVLARSTSDSNNTMPGTSLNGQQQQDNSSQKQRHRKHEHKKKHTSRHHKKQDTSTTNSMQQ